MVIRRPTCLFKTKYCREGLCTTFLGGVSTRTLGLMSERLIGWKVFSIDTGKASKALTEAIEVFRERDLSDDPIQVKPARSGRVRSDISQVLQVRDIFPVLSLSQRWPNLG
jgi:hypothetical protein